MNTSWRSEIPQWLILGGMLAAAAILWPYAPDTFPVHWNGRGEVDRFGGKFEGLLAVPLASVFLYGLLLMIPRFDPGRANYQSFRSAYLAIRLSILLFLAVIYGAMLLVAFGYPLKIGVVVPLAIGFLFLMLGNFMGKIRPNWFCGIRTPWTLSSRRSWNQTHRLGGWLFILIGLTMGLYGLIQADWMLIVTAVVTAVSMIWLVVYSYVIWRSDPEKLSPGAICPAPEGNDPV